MQVGIAVVEDLDTVVCDGPKGVPFDESREVLLSIWERADVPWRAENRRKEREIACTIETGDSLGVFGLESVIPPLEVGLPYPRSARTATGIQASHSSRAGTIANKLRTARTVQRALCAIQLGAVMDAAAGTAPGPRHACLDGPTPDRGCRKPYGSWTLAAARRQRRACGTLPRTRVPRTRRRRAAGRACSSRGVCSSLRARSGRGMGFHRKAFFHTNSFIGP